MKALCWMGREDVRIEDVPDPQILNPRDAIVRVTSTAICGSDLHLYGGFIPTMERGDVLGHEFMGEVVEVGAGVKNLAIGDRVVVPFPIACGDCSYCRADLWSLCDNSNPNAWMAEELFGHSPAGIFGYSHMLGGYAGGQAEYVRVPFADVGPLKVDATWRDEQVLLLTDVIPTGWMAAEQGDIRPTDVVAVWGCGPIGQIAVRAAKLLGAACVIAIDRVDARLRLAERHGARVIDEGSEPVLEVLRDVTAGRGPDVCIDAVGLEAHGSGALAAYDRVATAVRFETDRSSALREAILACRKGGTVSIAGVYGGYLDKVPLGAAFNKALRLRMGQTHVHRYLRPLLKRIGEGELDATDLITHRLPLARAPEAYETFRDKEDECIKVLLEP
jgi:threonine dehydrogenase-like Zn-dependent dehydrogenase